MAARGATAAMLAAFAAGTVRPAIFYEGVYNGGTLRLWTGIGTISWNGQSWTGGGQLLGISPITEASDISAQGFTVTLSGMPSALIAIALANVRQGRSGKLWLGCFDSSWALIADPYQLAEGRFDLDIIEDDGDTCTIGAQYEGRLISLERAKNRRYTHEDQQIDYPGDNGFIGVAALQDMQILWGGPAAAAAPIAQPTDSAVPPVAGGDGGGDSGGGGIGAGVGDTGPAPDDAGAAGVGDAPDATGPAPDAGAAGVGDAPDGPAGVGDAPGDAPGGDGGDAGSGDAGSGDAGSAGDGGGGGW